MPLCLHLSQQVCAVTPNCLDVFLAVIKKSVQVPVVWVLVLIRCSDCIKVHAHEVDDCFFAVVVLIEFFMALCLKYCQLFFVEGSAQILVADAKDRVDVSLVLVHYVSSF